MKEYFNRKNNTQCKTRWEKDMENVLLAYINIRDSPDNMIPIHHEKWQIRDTLCLYKSLAQAYREDGGETKAKNKFGILEIQPQFIPKTLIEDEGALAVPRDEILPSLIAEIKSLKSEKSSIRGKLEEVLKGEYSNLRCDNVIEHGKYHYNNRHEQFDEDGIVDLSESEADERDIEESLSHHS